MGGKSSTDFGEVAATQGAENREVVSDQLYANRPDQYTPWGYNKWTTNTDEEGNKHWSQTQGLTPELQDIYNKQTAITGGKTDLAGQLTGRMQNEFGQAQDWRGLTPMGQVPTSQFTIPEGDIGNPNAYRQHAEDMSYNTAQSRLAPQFQGQRNEMEAKMRNQGLGPEDAAWKARMAGIGQQETDAYGQARNDAVGQGRAESSQMWGQNMDRNQNNFNQAYQANQANFGQAMTGSKYANQIRQQQITEAMQKRGQSLNEMNAIQSGTQVGMPQMPNFSQAQSAAPAPIYQGAADQQSVANAQNPMMGLVGAASNLGSAYLGNR